MEKRYLGDCVYAEMDKADIVLTTDNGSKIREVIYLEPSVVTALLQFITDLKAEG